MEALIFATNAVLPLVLLAALGYGLGRSGRISQNFAAGANKLVFHVFLPVLLFVNIYEAESLADIDWGYALFALAGMTGAFLVGLVLVLVAVREDRRRGTVLQCVFRSNFAILGVPLALSLFGTEGAQAAAVLSLFTIPLNNILAVVALRLFDREGGKRPTVRAMLRDMARNKLILAVLAGLLALCIRAGFTHLGIAFRLRDLRFLYTAMTSLSAVTLPLSLMALGAQFTFSSIRDMLTEIALATVMRLVVVPTVMLTTAYLWFPAYYGAPFAALISMFATPVAVSSAAMAAELGGDGALAGQLVVWTTLCSALTIFLFITVFRALGALG